jgi:hypothetical protein
MISDKTAGETRAERWNSEHREMAAVELQTEEMNRKYIG